MIVPTVGEGRNRVDWGSMLCHADATELTRTRFCLGVAAICEHAVGVSSPLAMISLSNKMCYCHWPDFQVTQVFRGQ